MDFGLLGEMSCEHNNNMLFLPLNMLLKRSRVGFCETILFSITENEPFISTEGACLGVSSSTEAGMFPQ